MNCPRCMRAMQEIESDGAMIDVCTSCRGTFLDAGEANRFTDDPQKLADALALPLLEAQTGHHCPRCGKVTTEGGLFESDFRVELCVGCGGMWFVSKQLSRLRGVVAKGVLPERPNPDSGRSKKGGKRSKSAEDPTGSGRAVYQEAAHRCPNCHAEATRFDRWSCSCGNVWDAFTTKGVCPKCGKEWSNTRCPRCGVSSPHGDWYL